MQEQINFRWDVPAQALEKWDRTIVAKATNDTTASINIYSTIGEFGDGSGMTAKIVSSILRSAKGAPVVVNINSGGGDFFEGLAINTLLSEYEGDVTVKVVGLAASAASVVAMAGDKIEIAEGAFLMIHNSWTMAIGNKSAMRDVADMLSKFDESMAGLYAAKTGKDEKEIKKMMDSETWIQGKDAVESGFAHSVLGSESIDKEEKQEYANTALRRVDTELAKAGMPRSERRALIKDLTGTPCATSTTPCASELVDALASILKTLKVEVKNG
jgi:ATP-dependent protease ClpP protease subunit